ncbi:hypothetical protein OIV83_005820 [Microbotryomycetes sp. JL201]|nr:hypothetical protein OIV83_005820 [Microbotryomycetes sp. JL201]
MPLVSYDSESEGEQPMTTTKSAAASAAAPASTRSAGGRRAKLDAPADSDADDDQDAQFDPDDAFGIGRIQHDGADADGNAQQASTVARSQQQQVVKSAPDVLVQDLAKGGDAGAGSLITRPSDNIVFYNPTYQDLTRPVQGPSNPWSERKIDKMNTITGNLQLAGHVEQQTYSEDAFKTQQRNFQVLGYAANPSNLSGDMNAGIVGDANKAYMNNFDTSGDYRLAKAAHKAQKRKRKAKGKLGEFDSEDEADDGDEAGEMDEQVQEDGSVIQVKKKKEKVQKEYLGPWAGWEGENIGTVAPTEQEYEEQEEAGGPPLNKRQRKEVLKDSGRQNEIQFGQEKSIFHGKELRDYMGRTYMHIPNDVDVNLHAEPGEQENFLPKRVVHTWSGHTKAVSKIRLFPQSGHMILSASMDARVKLWDVYHEGKCLRTFMGHSKAVHDVVFDHNGGQFLSAGFDRQMKLWDTETGACKQAFSNGKIPYCIVFNPNDENQFLAGMSDKKIVQYDMRSNEIVQEYDQHLGPVNTITFLDENRRFISSSDDKTMRVWDVDIPVPIKLIADPTMHSMPAVTKHPNGKWLAAQSLDNQILLFGADSFKQNRKKRFAGHTVAGYACEPNFSPDGRYLSSGDSHGNLVIWDFKTSRILNRIRVHQKALVSHAWLPHETSKVVTSSFDGTIKMLD